MTCETAQAAISLRLDAELGDEDERVSPDDLERHLEDCAACRAFDERTRLIRTQLRYESLEDMPDVAPRVRSVAAALPPSRSSEPRGRRRARILAVAASFLVGALIGVTLVIDDGTSPSPIAAADIPAQVAAAQFDLDALDAELEMIERGWHTEVDERRWTGSLAWRTPETLTLELRDRTAYPSEEWVDNDVSLIVDEDRYWTSGPRDCPSDQQPDCTIATPRVEVLTGREPFADDAAIPLDLLVPVRSFAGAAPPPDLGQRTVAGRRTVGVATTAAQVQPVLDGLSPAGNLREVHPADTVELWLDAVTMVPLAVAVTAGDAPDRAAWAANRGYRDSEGDVVLEMAMTSIDYDPEAMSVDPPPAGATAERAAGFTDGPAPVLDGLPTPNGFRLHRRGRLVTGGPAVEIASWTDGRGWVKVRATAEWPGVSLFGDLGPLVRTVDLGDGGVGYLNPPADRIAIHGDGIDVTVTGSVGEEALRHIAAGLGVVGRPVPPDWVEAASASVDEAAVALPGLIVPSGLDGFGTPSVRADGSTIVASYTGPGTRAFLLTESPGNRLIPPLDLSVTAVEVRGETGRWSSARGELEWSEADLVLSLQSTTLSLNELLAVAQSMTPA